MQEKEKNNSPIKQRILLFASKQGISKRDFYAKIGVSRGTLESKTGITEDVLTKFFAAYPNVSVVWVMTGEGSDTKTKDFATMQEKERKSSRAEDKLWAMLEERDIIIRKQAEEIGQLRERLEQTTRRLEKIASNAHTSDIADVG